MGTGPTRVLAAGKMLSRSHATKLRGQCEARPLLEQQAPRAGRAWGHLFPWGLRGALQEDGHLTQELHPVISRQVAPTRERLVPGRS